MKSVWATRSWKAWTLTPISVLFYILSNARRLLFNLGVLRTNQFSVPVIVVGNISVGGTGKTPIVGVLIERLQRAGFHPGIVSRGYGAQTPDTPRLVSSDTPANLSGDEPALLARQTGVPVCIHPNRSAAVQTLIEQTDVNVVVSDDGMQHYAMSRNVEIAVVDGVRGLGNGFLLPAGALREPASRLRKVDLVAVQQSPDTATDDTDSQVNQIKNSHTWLLSLLGVDNEPQPTDKSAPMLGNFVLKITQLKHIRTDKLFELSMLQGWHVHAVAGLGNPQRFFDALKQHGATVQEHALPDHHPYVDSDLRFNDDLPILVTSKDAVKIAELNLDKLDVFEVCVEAVLNSELDMAIDKLVATIV